MIYPIYVHQEGDSAWGATFPDIPGCFTAADDLDDLPRAAQEAIEVHFDGEEDAIPPPGDLERLKDIPEFNGGFWMFVDIDLSKVNTPSERVNVSFPGNVLRRIDQYAAANGMTRSGFLTFAAARMMDGERLVSQGIGGTHPEGPAWQTHEAMAKNAKYVGAVIDAMKETERARRKKA